jgi:GNAT superfamily N-acetyltransferase
MSNRAALRVASDVTVRDIDVVHGFLTMHSTWARGIDRARVERSIRQSLCFAGRLPNDDGLIAFARVITDRATFAYLADVFVLPAHRGRGLARRLMEAVIAHPDLQGLRRFMLATSDAHGLYAAYGFAPPLHPQTLMERCDPDIYLRDAPTREPP